MSREYTNCNPNYKNEPLPDGRRTWKVLSVRKYMKKETEMFFWELAYDGGEGTQLLLPSMMKELLTVLGCAETEPGVFDWETELIEGKVFDATVSHGPDKSGVMRQNMTDFAASATKEEDVPF